MLLQILESLNLPIPEPEYKFHSKRKWLFDFAFPDLKIAIEVEGGVWNAGRHVRGKGFLNDMEKYNEAAIMGWRLIRITPQMITDGTGIDLIERILNGNN